MSSSSEFFFIQQNILINANTAAIPTIKNVIICLKIRKKSNHNNNLKLERII